VRERDQPPGKPIIDSPRRLSISLAQLVQKEIEGRSLGHGHSFRQKDERDYGATQVEKQESSPPFKIGQVSSGKRGLLSIYEAGFPTIFRTSEKIFHKKN
jgi:hypothetical protein